MTELSCLLIAPNIDGTDVGEAFVAFKWAEALSARVNLTVLSFSRAGRTPLGDQLPGARVVTVPEPRLLAVSERFNAMAKPGWPLFCRQVRRFVRAAAQRGERFDVAHQLMPNAARYASPLTGLGIPYVIGPVGGGLTTPPAFRAECGTAPWYTRLRAIDRARLAADPWLRRSYSEAELVIGVAPYVADHLAPVPLKRFESMLEIGVDGLAPARSRAGRPGALRLLHVGRGVRTKGLRDAVRAIAHCRDLPEVTLTSAGAGEEIAICAREAAALGVADRVHFLGGRPRAEIEALYAEADAFLFPSFREPAGGVLLEAMRWGLPVITVRRGGPDFIVDDGSGLKVDVTTPEQMPGDLAAAVRALALDPDRRDRLAAGARGRVERIGLWRERARWMAERYREVAEGERVGAHSPAGMAQSGVAAPTYPNG